MSSSAMTLSVGSSDLCNRPWNDL